MTLPLPSFSTDGSRDIPDATAAHTAELDREAVEGMTQLPAAGESEGERDAAADVAVSLEVARARAQPTGFESLPPPHDPLADIGLP